MFVAVGLISREKYVIGTKEECFRELHKQYPNPVGRRGTLTNAEVYPEPLQIIKREEI